MSTAAAAFPGQTAPALSLPSINTGETFTLQDSKPDLFTVVIFYRGVHCPICQTHLKEIEEQYQMALDAGINIVAVSMDTRERAEKFHKQVAAAMNKESLQVPILYNLTEKQARDDWGLYLSNKRPGTSEPELYSEPGLFVVRPEDHSIFMAQTQSAPFTRPSMEQLVGGLLYAHENKYPTRGTVVAAATNTKTTTTTDPLTNSSNDEPELVSVQEQQ